MRRDAASIVANWPLWKQQIRLTKYSPEVDFGENKIMSVNQDEPVAELVKAMRHRHDDYVESICDLKARVAELEGVIRDVKEYDIDRAFSDGRNGFYLLPHEIRAKIADALEGPANEG